VETLFFI